MNTEMLLALGILTVAIIFFITEWLRVDVVAILVMVSLMLTGLLSPQEAISGFSNPAVLTIASLFIVGGAVMHTGLAGEIGQRILKIAGGGSIRLLVIIMTTVALLSSFISSTGTVALLLPAIISLSASLKISPSKLLIPLAFASLLGGVTTLIGTPPNLIVSDILREQGFTPFQFFDFTLIGLALFAAGVIYMLLVGRHLLPDHKPKQEVQRIETPEELVSLYRLPDNLFRLRVRRTSDLVGQTIAGSRLRQDYNVSVLEIIREAKPKQVAKLGERSLVVQSNGKDQFVPTADTIIYSGDILIAQGDINDIGHAAASWNLGVQPAEADSEYSLISHEVGIAEILLPPRSSLLGKTLVESRFGSVFRLTVLDIHRPGITEKLPLKSTRLQFGDSLLVQGSWENILELRKQRRDFVVMGQPEQMMGAPTRAKAPLALLIMAGMIILMITNIVSITEASMLAGLAMILTGCLSIDDAYEAVDWKSIVLIAGMLPMSIALERVGLVNLVAQGLVDYLGVLDPVFLLGGLFLLTSFFTQVLSNTATTVLIAPIALVSAQKMGVDAHAFAMVVAIAASMAFGSPVASPVNTLVMGAGRYSFADYIKVGGPLMVIMLIVCIILIPIIFPFY
jgi:di/tricarboxylate transporter